MTFIPKNSRECKSPKGVGAVTVLVSCTLSDGGLYTMFGENILKVPELRVLV